MPRLADPELPARRRAQILEAARYCFHARGFRQTTIEDICGEARISPGALYRYFDTKADIIAAIALDARAQAEAALERLSTAEGLIEGLTELARSAFAGLEDAGDAALMAEVWAEAARDPLLAKALAARDVEAQARLSAAISAAVRAGSVYPALTPEDAAALLLSTLDGIGLRLALRREQNASEAVRRFRSLAVHVLKPKR